MDNLQKNIRIILADDHTVVREAIRELLVKHKNLEVIAGAADGRELLSLVKQQQPDIVITDISMPFLNGIEATRTIVDSYPGIGVIALTMFDESHMLIDIAKAGARGYLLKSTTEQELMKAIEAVNNGGNYYTREVAEKLVAIAAKSRFRSPTKNPSQFSASEVEIIKLICDQLSSKEIADRLGLKKRSVENYREKIQKKIGARNMIGIVLYAIQNNIYRPK